MSATLTLATFLALAPQCASAVHPDTLASVIKTESNFAVYSIGVNHNGKTAASYRFGTKQEAADTAKLLIAEGVTNLDLGPAQISWKAGHLQKRGLGPADAFDPRTALCIASDVLADCWSRAPAREEQARLDETAACYNSGGFIRPLYVRRLRASAEVVVPALRVAGVPAAAAPPRSAPAAPTPPAPAVKPCAPVWDAMAMMRCTRLTRIASTTSETTQ